jgi:hypothetical protein
MSWRCHFPGCGTAFETPGKLEHHTLRIHKGALHSRTEITIGECSTSGSLSGPTALPAIALGNEWATTRKIADTLFDWELEHRVPQTVKEKQKKDIENMYQAKVEQLQQHVDTQLSQIQIAPDAPLPAINLRQCPGVSNFFPDALRSIHMERKFARIEFGMVEHVVVKLGTSHVTVHLANGDQVAIESQDEAIIFPFAESVQRVMEQQDLYDAMQVYRRQRPAAGPRDCNPETDTICSVFHGYEWRASHPFFVKHRDSYAISFYYDEVTVTNPLGQYKRKVQFMPPAPHYSTSRYGCHMCLMQVGFFYWTLHDLGPAFSGKDCTIWPAFMAWDDNLSNPEYVDKMIQHPRSMGTQLALFQSENGCVTPTAYGPQALHMDILSVSADAPAAGFLAGRVMSFSKATYFCRACNAGQKDRLTFVAFLMQFLVMIGYLSATSLYVVPEQLTSHIQLLTKEEDQQQREQLRDQLAAASRANRSTKTVIAKFTKLSGLKDPRHFMHWAPFIHISCCLIQDGMHVLLEGVVKYVLYLTIHWMVNALKLPLATVNYMIQNHEYLPQERADKPSEIRANHLEGAATTSGKIKQTAGQVLVLVRNFIPIFGPLIWSKGWSSDPKWQCCECILLICLALMASEFTIHQLLAIEQQIGEFYVWFLAAWGANLATPKFHYMMHIPLEIFLFGPMRFVWCMRFEAKHQW